MAHLLTHADRQRQRTGQTPLWQPYVQSVSQLPQKSSLQFPRCTMNARPADSWCNGSPAELLQLAYCVWNAELELTPMHVRRPGLRQMGLTNEPRIIHAGRSAAILIVESSSRVIVAAASASPATGNGLEELAGSIVEAHAEGLVPAPGNAPGYVSRHDLELARLLWSTAEAHVPTTTRELVLAGHGQAAAAVTLAALAARQERPECGISVVTFGSPPVGDRNFCSAYDQAIPRHARIESADDIVPHLSTDPLLLSLIWPEQAAQLRAAHTVLSHVGRLQYFHHGHAVANISEHDLSRLRRFRLFSLLCSGNREAATRDHSLEQGYLPALAAADQPLNGVRTPQMESVSPTTGFKTASKNERGP